MPTTQTVRYGQTSLDIAIQYLGDCERHLELCELNGIGPTDDLVVGSQVLVPDTAIEKKAVTEVFIRRKIDPASSEDSFAANPETPPDEGIDYWEIEEDFIVQ